MIALVYVEAARVQLIGWPTRLGRENTGGGRKSSEPKQGGLIDVCRCLSVRPSVRLGLLLLFFCFCFCFKRGDKDQTKSLIGFSAWQLLVEVSLTLYAICVYECVSMYNIICM